mgnify:FL=1
MGLNKKTYIFILFILTFYSCESSLNPPVFEVYLCPASDLNITLKNVSELSLSWTFSDSNIEDICDKNISEFIISYLVSDILLPDHPNLSNFLDTGNYTQIPVNDYGANNFAHDFPNYNSDKYYYFSIYVKYFDSYSAESAQGSYLDGIGSPNVSCTKPGISDNHDSDFIQCSISNDDLNIHEDFSNLFLNEEIFNSITNTIVRTTSIVIEEETKDDTIIRDLFLDYKNCEMGVDTSQLYSCIELNNNSYLHKNTEYKVRYFYTQTINGIITPEFPVVSDFYIFEFIRPENAIVIYSQPVNDVLVRIYIQDVNELIYYDNLSIWSTLDNSNLSNIVSTINIENYKNNFIFDNYIHIDIEHNEEGLYYLVLNGNESHYGYSVSFSLLTLPGFNLIDLPGIDDDFYMSQYELTEDSFNTNWSNVQNNLPKEISLLECEDYITQSLSLEYSNYTFRIPTFTEWEYAANMNIYLGIATEYPWGNVIDSYHANYYNSDQPLIDTGYNGIVGVGTFNQYNSHSGISDMSGNLSEWTKRSNDQGFTIKGGNYLSSSDDLKILNDITNQNITNNTYNGMGCRIILEK